MSNNSGVPAGCARRYVLVLLFGWANLLFLLACQLWPVSLAGAAYAWPQAASLMLLQLVVSSALIYAASQRRAGTDIGHKVYTAALVSYLLWACMLLRWLNY